MQTQTMTQPFSCSFSPQIPELLQSLNCSLAISTYQAGKIVLISPKDNERLVQLPRTFNKPMGIAIHESDPNKIAIACKDEVVVFKNSKSLAEYYPKGPGKYDSMYMPRMVYKTNFLDLHDLEFGEDGLYGVNTLFSCIVKLSDDYSFIPYWKPDFVTEIASEDRCHLNGMIMQNGKPKFVTCFNKGNTPQSWRNEIKTGGMLIDIESNDIIAEGLAMPHSPRMINGKIYCLLSATGELVEINPNTGATTTLVKFDGFVRGMSFHKDYLFVGLSKLRENSSTFKELVPNLKRNRSGIAVVHLPTASLQGEIVYQTSVDEIYDVKVLANNMRPNILNPDSPESKQGLTIPETSFWARTENLV